MYNEFEIAYEAIASEDAAGYEPYEISILLSQAQDQIIKGLVGSGIEASDTKSLVLGPKIKTAQVTSSNLSDVYPSTYILIVDESDYWAIVNERLKEAANTATIEVRPIDHSFFEANKDNPFKKPDSTRYYWRFIEGNASDTLWMVYGPAGIHTYYINYLDKPDPIIVPGVALTTIIDGQEVTDTIVAEGLDCEFNNIIHRDIIIRAAQLGKAFIGDPQGFQLLTKN
ncbi:MAG: hypothetical protein DRQ35_05980 [Gammaproteobacteria bacterium]|nr:MAG: hypothetical protein DRQ35_05980 [Gammaproteobacteria bacterium]